MQRGLSSAGIQSAVHYPSPIHLMPAYADARYTAGDFPASEAAARTVLSLPLHPYLGREDIKRVSAEIFKLVDKKHQAAVPSVR